LIFQASPLVVNRSPAAFTTFRLMVVGHHHPVPFGVEPSGPRLARRQQAGATRGERPVLERLARTAGTLAHQHDVIGVSTRGPLHGRLMPSRAPMRRRAGWARACRRRRAGPRRSLGCPVAPGVFGSSSWILAFPTSRVSVPARTRLQRLATGPGCWRS
jgi:hypothetical protein